MRQSSSMAAALIAAQEDERGRLARELHDGVMQQVFALVHRVDRMECLLERGDVGQAVERAGSMRQILVELADELRAVIRDLRPPALEELGLLRAVAMLVGQPSDEAPAVSLRVEGVERRLAPQSELALFRIVQEAWSNILRHAHAHHVAIVFRYTHSQIIVSISDDGVGFVPGRDGYGPDGHWGLRGMRERAELAGGALEVRSIPGGGTHLALQIPLDDAGEHPIPPIRPLARNRDRRADRAAHQPAQRTSVHGRMPIPLP